MALFYGSSGCTSQLVRDLWALGVPGVETFPQIEPLFYRIDSVVAERRAQEQQLELATAEVARGGASTLEQALASRVSERAAELASERDRLSGEIEDLASEISLRRFKGLLRIPEWLPKLLRHRTLTRHLDREARRSFRHDLAQIDRLRATATNIERNLASTVESRVAPYVRAKRYFECQTNRITFLGAKGEELVLEALRALPDEFTVISDVRVDLGRSARWRARPGVRVRSAQIDHVVVGPDCVFLLETKNWSPETVNTTPFSPQEQISRAAYIFYLLAYTQFGRRKMPRRDVVVQVGDKSRRWRVFDPPHQYVHQVPISALVAFIRSQRRQPTPDAVTAGEMVDWLQRRTISESVTHFLVWRLGSALLRTLRP